MRQVFSLVLAGLIVLLSAAGGVFATPQLLTPPDIAPQAAALDWATTFSLRGLSSDVNAVAANGNTIYVGGNFIAAGNVAAKYVARYDLVSQTWSALGAGAPDAVKAILVDGNDIYIGGEFFLNRWNTISNTWTSLAYPSGVVYALAKNGNTLYAAGAIEWIGGQAVTNTARLNLATGAWSPLGAGTDNVVYALTTSGNAVYVGGDFTHAGDVPALSVAQWDITTNSWSSLSTGPYTGTTYALAMNGTELIAGGQYGNATGASVYRWDGTWHALGTNTWSTIKAVNANPYGIYATGQTSELLRWNGSAWVQVGGDLTGPLSNKAFALAYAADHLYIGGAFTGFGSITTMRAADLNLTNTIVSPLFSGPGGNGLDGDINAIVISGTTTYVGGSFSRAGPIAASNIARWNGSSWSALGAGVDAQVLALARQGNTLYVGGRFTSAGGSDAHYLARWDTGTQAWFTVNSGGREGVLDTVHALAISGTQVYVGGYFTYVGWSNWPYGPATDYFAVWDSTTGDWTTVNPGLKNYVDAIAVHGNDVYVGGGFYPNGGSNFDGLARWDTLHNQWSGIPGASANVYAMALSGDDLYVGGTFAPNRIRRLNTLDNTWLPMTSGVYGGGYDGIVYAIGPHADGDIYVGGDFTYAGGRAIYNLARYNPACDLWLPVGAQGVSDRVLALAPLGDQLTVGGRFSLASEAGGNVVSARLATLPHQSITCHRAFLPTLWK